MVLFLEEKIFLEVLFIKKYWLIVFHNNLNFLFLVAWLQFYWILLDPKKGVFLFPKNKEN